MVAHKWLGLATVAAVVAVAGAGAAWAVLPQASP